MAGLKNGVSERTHPFQPGFDVCGEPVCRTFQPSYVVRRDGTIIAFCQGRLREGRDDDPKVILASKSDDMGATWSPATTVSDKMNHYAMSAYLSDRSGSERISVLTMVDLRGTEDLYGKDYKHMRERTGIDIDAAGRKTPMVLCRFDSDDGGDTWTPQALLGDRSPLNRCYADGTLIMFNPIGQVHAIPDGPFRGRYVIGGPVTVVPGGETVSDHFRNHPQSGSATIYSDDQGETWRVDGFVNDYAANEASAVSIDRGRNLLMIRRLNRGCDLDGIVPLPDTRPASAKRLAQTSSGCGMTWSEPFLVDISGVFCHGTLARTGDRLLFSIPLGSPSAEEGAKNSVQRQRGAIYFSDDEGRTWRHRIIEAGTFSYSTVGPLDTSRSICLFARGSMGQDGVGCRVFTNDWLDG